MLKTFELKLYKLCDSKEYTYDKILSLRKEGNAAENITPTHETVLQSVGCRLLTDNYFSSPVLFLDVHNRKVNSCSIVHHGRSGMPTNIGPESLKLKKGDIMHKVKGARAVC
jgi:hypothetical protein